ncbi:general substrate transporter, partial [Aureobasidium melanogenum]
MSNTQSDQSMMVCDIKSMGVWADIKQYRRAYILTAVTSFGGMLFGWDTGLIGGVLTMDSFKNSFDLNGDHAAYANLSGNIVSVLQAGCFIGAAASFWVSDTFGRKLVALSVITRLPILYVGRVIGGIGVGLISAVVPTYIGENVNKEIRGRCIGTMQLFNVTGIMLSYFVNYGVTRSISTTNDAQWRVP